MEDGGRTDTWATPPPRADMVPCYIDTYIINPWGPASRPASRKRTCKGVRRRPQSCADLTRQRPRNHRRSRPRRSRRGLPSHMGWCVVGKKQRPYLPMNAPPPIWYSIVSPIPPHAPQCPPPPYDEVQQLPLCGRRPPPACSARGPPAKGGGSGGGGMDVRRRSPRASRHSSRTSIFGRREARGAFLSHP